MGFGGGPGDAHGVEVKDIHRPLGLILRRDGGHGRWGVGGHVHRAEVKDNSLTLGFTLATWDTGPKV